MRLVDHGIPDRRDVPTMPKVLEALREIIDPELGLDVVALGLIYELEIDGQNVWVRMTMTSQACPVGPQLLDGVKRNIEMHVPGVKKCEVEVVWLPPWTPEMISPEGRAALGC